MQKNTLFPHTSIQKLLEKYHTIWALESLTKLSEWDLETYMPEDGVTLRGQAMAKTKTVIQEKYLDKDFRNLLEKAQQEKELTDPEKGVVRNLTRAVDKLSKLPPSFVEELETTVNEAHVAWRKARQDNNFNLFKTSLEKLISLNQKKASYFGYQDHPYDALLDEYEEGSTVKQLNNYFNDLAPFIKDLIDRVKQSDKFISQHSFKKLTYPIQQLKELDTKILAFFEHDPKKLRIDVSTHPFTQAVNTNDVRITTRYLGEDFASTMMSTVHEFGHALYELQSDPQLSLTPIAGGLSLGIHESQSRFWENFIGRSRPFIERFLPEIKKLNPKLVSAKVEDVYHYMHTVSPSLIRVEADEVTYHMHILVRFELEKLLMEGKLAVNELPDAWNDKYDDLLGVKSTTYSQGVLQDIHWSMGAFGYFDTYSVGTVVSAIWKQELEKKHGPIDSLLKQKDGISIIKNWLGENLHQYGSTYTLNELIKKVTGKSFTAEPWKNYIRETFGELYSL